MRRHLLAQRGRGHWCTVNQTQQATRKSNTPAGSVVWELERRLGVQALKRPRGDLQLYRQALAQKPHDHDKIYSLHEPHI